MRGVDGAEREVMTREVAAAGKKAGDENACASWA